MEWMVCKPCESNVTTLWIRNSSQYHPSTLKMGSMYHKNIHASGTKPLSFLSSQVHDSCRLVTQYAGYVANAHKQASADGALVSTPYSFSRGPSSIFGGQIRSGCQQLSKLSSWHKNQDCGWPWSGTQILRALLINFGGQIGSSCQRLSKPSSWDENQDCGWPWSGSQILRALLINFWRANRERLSAAVKTE